MSAFLERYGPVALVTGASSGIGWAFAEELATRGFDLVLAARRTDRLEQLAAKLEAAHGTATQLCESDLSKPDAPAALLAATAGKDIGLVISNAGFNIRGYFETTDAVEMAEMLTVNCHAPMQLAHGFLPRLKARGKGGIVFTSSVEGFIGCPFSTAYSATKALVIGLGEGLFGELAGSGVDVLTLCPGATESEATAKYAEKYAAVPNMQPAREVAQLTLDNITNGPVFVPNAHYKAQFEQLTAMPRAQAVVAMASALKATL
ncbi:SDR family NAD(P)-dependent oxidoreductase [Novosphingobium sp. G106]|uniref:SDR family NAD(P)-dependent oxidoreductase n=1 Tax=Novosphingobium sp. G106 TaxID=2849500 RepID=UPI001C2DE837|nr:SDR family NAD(P)-dependent oxidoreductase [Novosphingobium sp. G106]MBV1690463.1 SDR family NAD(P)-dependent oxidoreductase [Novosphingobium sp. G106]